MEKNEKPFYKKLWFILILIFVIFPVLITVIAVIIDPSLLDRDGQESSQESIVWVDDQFETQSEEILGESEVTTSNDTEYINFIVNYSNIMSDNLTKFSNANLELSNNTDILFDEDWKFSVAIYLVSIEEICQDAIDYDPVPDNLFEVHQEIILASKAFINMKNRYIEGIDNIDVDKILEATELMSMGNQHIDNALTLLLSTSN